MKWSRHIRHTPFGKCLKGAKAEYVSANCTVFLVWNLHSEMVIPKLGGRGTQGLSTAMIQITPKQFSWIMEAIMFQQPSIQLLISSPSLCLSSSGGLQISTFLLLRVFHLVHWHLLLLLVLLLLCWLWLELLWPRKLWKIGGGENRYCCVLYFFFLSNFECYKGFKYQLWSRCDFVAFVDIASKLWTNAADYKTLMLWPKSCLQKVRIAPSPWWCFL